MTIFFICIFIKESKNVKLLTIINGNILSFSKCIGNGLRKCVGFIYLSWEDWVCAIP